MVIRAPKVGVCASSVVAAVEWANFLLAGRAVELEHAGGHIEALRAVPGAARCVQQPAAQPLELSPVAAIGADAEHWTDIQSVARESLT